MVQRGPATPVQHQFPKDRAFPHSDGAVKQHVDAATHAPVSGLKQLLYGHGRAGEVAGSERGAQKADPLRGLPFHDQRVHVHGVGAEVTAKLLLFSGKMAEPQEELPFVDLYGIG